MTLHDWLSVVDTIGLPCNIWIAEDEGSECDEPIYCGSMWDIPYWIADMKIAKYNNSKDKDKPIWFAHNIRKYSNDENGTEGYNGFVITVTEGEDNE